MTLIRKITLTLTLACPAFAAQNLAPHLEEAFQKQQWNEVVQIASDMIRQNPNDAKARLRGAFGLIQRGYPNAALHLLRPMSLADWKAIPSDMKQIVEVVALFQKKVPFINLAARMDQLNEAEASTVLQDEIRFAKGRAAFESKQTTTAQAILAQVSRGSRYYGPANYLLGALAVRSAQYDVASKYFALTFDPQVLQQSAEFWKDLGPQITNQFGTTLNVLLDTDSLHKTNDVAELTLMAMARVLYAQKDFDGAVAQYARIPATSSLYFRAKLETIWALLQANKHEAAVAAATELAHGESSFESLQARPARALILTDSAKPLEGRVEITHFLDIYTKTKEALQRYRQFPSTENLPAYLQADIKADTRQATVAEYQRNLQAEIAALRTEDRLLFPVFGSLSSELQPLISQASQYSTRLKVEQAERRLADLDRLYVQSRLTNAETFLEEREILRGEVKGKGLDEAGQDAHDRKLVGLLKQAIHEVDDARAAMKDRNLSLDFRQSELLWELSAASAFLDKEGAGKSSYETYRAQAVAIAKDLVDNQPGFPKRAQAMFFLGFALLEVGKEKDALSYLNAYVKQFPQHENVPNAYRILADVEFDANRWQPAENLYKEILKFPASPIIGYALYKIGWCNYSQKNYAKAMLGLEQAIQWTRNLENTDQLLNLKREAGRDLISMYAEVGNHKRAYEYFERFVGGSEGAKWLADLAREYERGGLFEKSTDLYTQLLGMEPSGEDKLAFQTSIIYGALQLRNWDMVLERTRGMVEGYLTTLQPEQPAETPAFKAEKTLNDVVMAQHFEYEKYATKEDIARVLAIDELYLKAFSQWKTSQMPAYQYAHLLLKDKKMPEAAKAFITHWEQFKGSLKEPLREEALRNVIHTLEATENNVEPMVKYTGEYAAGYPTGKQARPIAFLRTVTILKNERDEEGLTETQKMFDDNMSDEFGAKALKNLRVIYYKLKDWKRTFEWATAMLAKPGIAKTPFVAELKTVREEALFLWADNTKENEKAAELYLMIAEDPQMLRLRAKALYNAFARYKEGAERIKALNVGKRLEQAAPTAPETLAIAGVRAAYYQEAGDYEKAFPLFEAFLKNPAKDTPKEALVQARLSTALMAEYMGKTTQATQLYTSLLGEDKPVAADAKRGLDRLAENAQRKPAAEKTPFKKWDSVVKTMGDMEKNALPKASATMGLAQRIQAGAAKLEKAVREFLELSGDPATPPFHAFEAYCSVPYLYTYYQKGIRSLGEGQPEDLKVELEKLASPLDAKASEIASQCLSRAMDGCHDGPTFRKVLAAWGWRKEAPIAAQADKLRQLLGSYAPWLEPAAAAAKEEEILQAHLEDKGNAESWYSLGRLRFDSGRMGLAKLTLLQTLAKYAANPASLNTLAVMKQMDRADAATLDSAFTKAAQAGSKQAWANLALVHLNGARLEKALEALNAAQNQGTFADKTDVGLALSELRALRQPASNDATQPGGTK
jgi:tetratricopeptide (TPR) repeat protein